MKLNSIRIKNFKSLQDVELEPSDFGCLVGENNAGKSSVLQALTYALRRPPSIPQDLYYHIGLPIEFKLTFSEIVPDDLARLIEDHRTRLEPLIVGGMLTVVVRYRVGERVAVTVVTRLPVEERFRSEKITDLFAGKRGAAVLAVLAEIYPEFLEGAPDQPNLSQAKAYLSGCINQLPPDRFADGETPLPSGISSSITDLLPEPIYIPAVKDVGDDLKTTQSTSFGRLLGLLLDDMMPDLAQFRQALEGLDRLFNRDFDAENIEDGRHQKVRDLEVLIEGYLSANFPRAKLELRVPPPELKTILNNAQLYVDDGARDLIDNKGDGIKRTMTFALLQAYVHRQSQNRASAENPGASRPLLFLFEEPELYLHPKSQRILFDTLANISLVHQVVVTTHSPLFFAPGVTAAFVRVAKQAREPKPVAKLYRVNFKLDAVSAEIFRLARFENVDAAFFSQRVVLFEGESDDAYCRHVAKLCNPDWDFDKNNISLVRVSGKGNFSRYRRFFESFGIEVKVIADLDALFEGHTHLGECDRAAELRAEMIQQVDGRVAALGVSAEPSARQIKDRLSRGALREKYEAARDALNRMSATGAIRDGDIDALSGLFVWEQPIARVKVCQQDAAALECLVPTLDAFRASGICILAKGAIEDYYPQAVAVGGSKPDRALDAAKLVRTPQEACSLSAPLVAGRQPEFFEIFTEIFRN